MVPAEPFAEITQPRGERGLVGGWLAATTLIARVVGLVLVGHAVDTRDDRGLTAAPEARGPYLLGLGESRIGGSKLSA